MDHVATVELAARPKRLTAGFNAAWLVLCALLLQWSGAEVRALPASSSNAVAGAQASYEPVLDETAVPNKATRIAAKEPRQPAALDTFDAPLLLPGAVVALLGPATGSAVCDPLCIAAHAAASHQPRAPPSVS